jgi:hypothetical protein
MMAHAAAHHLTSFGLYQRTAHDTVLWLGSGKFLRTISYVGQTNQSSPWLVILEMSYHPTFTGKKRGRVGRVGEYPKNQIDVSGRGSKQLM